LWLQSLPVPAERLENSPHLMDEAAAAMLVHAFKLEADQLQDCRLIAPKLFSTDPVEAASIINKDPGLTAIMLKTLASRIFTPERLSMEQAVTYIKEARPGIVGLPLLEELTSAEQASKKSRTGPQKPAEQRNILGMH